ncbi:MAG: hypothetical protein LPK19_09740 [Hymenobacteraceae bacterium]|nr:hypothetical protein [Hymenobacteraceae bacterium]MDX5396502.1 hypothetical protein [Hymenobacteraceae bacterium]MDX5512569.1 hypothetical protein [Hymenobacteraceae bacterium]
MNNLSNPLFENEKEFLERQKEEYENALRSNVTEIKFQTEKVGKNLLIAGGALAAAYVLTKMFGGGKKSKKKKKKKLYKKRYFSEVHQPYPEHEEQHYGVVAHDQDNYRMPRERFSKESGGITALAKSFMNSEVVTMISHQLAALLMVYITKRIEDYLEVHKIHDIAEINAHKVTDVDFTYHEEDAPKSDFSSDTNQ